MAMNYKRKSNKSLSAKSMKMVVNVMKLSSLSIPRTTLATVQSLPATKGSVKVAANPPLTQFSGSHLAQMPMVISKPVAYCPVEPEKRSRSSYVVSEDNGIDSKASDYIRKVRENIRQGYE